LGELIGISMAAGIFTGAFAPYFAGFLFDVSGTYFLVFTTIIVLLLLSGVFAGLLQKPGKP